MPKFDLSNYLDGSYQASMIAIFGVHNVGKTQWAMSTLSEIKRPQKNLAMGPLAYEASSSSITSSDRVNTGGNKDLNNDQFCWDDLTFLVNQIKRISQQQAVTAQSISESVKQLAALIQMQSNMMHHLGALFCFVTLWDVSQVYWSTWHCN